MFEFADLVVEPDNYRVSRNGKTIPTTGFQLRLLTLFIRNPRRVFTLPELGDALWPDGEVDIATVRRSVVRLKKLLVSPSGSASIRSVFGVGYSLDIE